MFSIQSLIFGGSRFVSRSDGRQVDMLSDPRARPRFRVLKAWLMRHFIVLIVLAVLVLVGIWVSDDYGISTDTGFQRRNAVETFEYLLGRSNSISLDINNRFHGVSYELWLLLVERAFGLDDTRDVHLMRNIITHLFFLMSGFFCYLLAYRLFGNRLLAVLAMLMFLLHPRIYAHSFFNSKDIPFLSMFMVCLYLTYCAFRNGNLRRFLILGVATGILVNLRIMGLTLFFCVVAMCVLDLFLASSASERKRALGSIAVFVLSCMAALYAVSTYLWGDPVGNFVEWFAVLSEYPVTVYQLFRGDVIASTDVNPPEYVPVWVSITTPLVVVVLGVVGMLVVLMRGAFNPCDVLGNMRLRFSFMLVGCLLLPVVATIVLSSNVYNGWRTVYFLYAPFCLLAVCGVHWLTSAMLHRRLQKLSALAVGSGIVAPVVAMASIHPYEYIYFNFLVDRTTPEHLRSQYDMDYWGTSFREGMEHLLERYPYSSLYMQSHRPRITSLTRELFPLSDRGRIFVFDRDADFFLATYENLEGNKIYGLKIYNSTVFTVTELSSAGARVDDIHRDIYVSAVSGNPVIRSYFDVFLDDRALIYVKDPCVVTDTEAAFFLHIVPSDVADLSEERREFGFGNIRFDFYRRGARVDNACIAKIDLPDYEIERIRTGQFERGEEDAVWKATYNMSAAAESPSVVERLRGSGVEPVIRSNFDVYLDAGRLIYFKSPCLDVDVDAPFFVHLYPMDVDDLPEVRRPSGFESFSFDLLNDGVMSAGGCFMSFDLPDYEIVGFLTGQFLRGEGSLWEAGHSFAAAELPKVVERLRDSGLAPVIRSYFDVYIDKEHLIYIREPCIASDTDTEIFLHVVPSSDDDLSPDRVESGFNNLDFVFETHGLMFDGMCVASVGLPDYKIERIRTGQWDAEQQQDIWREEFDVWILDADSGTGQNKFK